MVRGAIILFIYIYKTIIYYIIIIIITIIIVIIIIIYHLSFCADIYT